MPLSEQEQHCIDLACRYLRETRGGSWSIEEYLDDLNPSDASPEVIVSNGPVRAAIEVKRLTGDSMQREYVSSLRSNEKFLTPSCGGAYYLSPPVDFRLPMDLALRRTVRREIERVAQALAPGENGAIRMPRRGYISMVSDSGPGYISCMHQGPHSDLLTRLAARLTGIFMLIDEGLEHSFVTKECEMAFGEAVVAACERRLQGNGNPFSWDEEWELARLDVEANGDAKNGVWIVAVTAARSMPDSVEECVHAVLDNAMRKFRTKRWADIQIVVLETSPVAPASLAARAVQTFDSANRGSIDYFLLVDDGDISDASALVEAEARAAEADEERRRVHVVESPLSDDRVERFKDDYLKGRRGIGAVEKVFSRSSAFQYRNERKESASFGFNSFVHKGPFVDGSNWADQRGWDFAVAEERHLLNKLHGHLAQSTAQSGHVLSGPIPREPGAIMSAVNEMSDLLMNRGFRASLIVVAGYLDTDLIIALEKELTTAGWELPDDLRTNWILGMHEDCPVLYIRDEALNSLYVVDVTRFARLLQFGPAVDLNMEAIDEARAKQILEERPDMELDVDALRAMVHLRLYQSYEFEIHAFEAVSAGSLMNPDLGSVCSDAASDV